MERITGAKNDSFRIGDHVIPISRSYNWVAHEKYDEYLRFQQECNGERMMRMVGRISVTTGQNEYRRISDVLSGDHKLAEDMKESRTEMFSFMSCAFFCCRRE